MISVIEAQKIISDIIQPLGEEIHLLREAMDRVLSQDIIADTDYPPFDRSAMDGYAVIADDVSSVLEVIETLHAGNVSVKKVGIGQCTRIFTGAPVPPGATKVVPQENVTLEGTGIRISKPSLPSHIRRKGEDFIAGSVVLKQGCVLGPAQLAIAASVGVTKIKVKQQPRVTILCMGDELVKPEQKPALNQIRNVNGILLSSLVDRYGGEIVKDYLLRDDYSHIRDVFEDILTKTDLILLSGGSSVGEKDFTRRLLEEAGFKIHFSRVAVRPGQPLIFATHQNQIAFGIPGNPVSHFVCFHLFIRLAIKAMAGIKVGLDFLSGILENDFDYSPYFRETYWPGVAKLKGEQTQLIPLPWKGSGHIAALAEANALIQIPPNQGPFLKGNNFQWLSLK